MFGILRNKMDNSHCLRVEKKQIGYAICFKIDHVPISKWQGGGIRTMCLVRYFYGIWLHPV